MVWLFFCLFFLVVCGGFFLGMVVLLFVCGGLFGVVVLLFACWLFLEVLLVWLFFCLIVCLLRFF